MSDDEPAKLPRAQMLTVGGASALVAMLSFVREADAGTPMGLDSSGSPSKLKKGTKVRGKILDFPISGAWEVQITHDVTKFLKKPQPDIVYAIVNGTFCGFDGDLQYSHHHKDEPIYIGVWTTKLGPAACPSPPAMPY